MAVSSARVAVTAEAKALNTAADSGVSLRVENVGEKAVDLGPSGVTAGEGFPLAASASADITLDAGDVLFAICGAAEETTLAVLRT